MTGGDKYGVPVLGPWMKSTYSPTNADECVEVAVLSDGGRAVRDSQNPDRAALHFTSGEWSAFIAGAKAGEFDL